MILYRCIAFLLIAGVHTSAADKQVSFSLDQETVDLGWARIGAEGISALHSALKEPLNSVRHINLANNFLDIESFRILGDILKIPSQLESLNLANNEISLAGASYIASGLQHNCGLQRLYLSHTSLQAAGVALIADAIDKNSNLTVLDISHCNIGDEGAKSIASMLQRDTGLRTLTIYSNDIRGDGAKAMFASLHDNMNLQRLYFGPGNQLPNGAVQLLSDYLSRQQSTIETLDVSGSDISDQGFKLLGAALKKQPKVKELAVKASDMSKSSTAKRFFNDLSGNTVLRHLDVSACRIDAGASYSVANFIRENTGLESLDLSFNRLRSNGGHVVLSALKQNSVLKNLDVSGNMLQSTFMGEGLSDLTNSLELLNVGQNNIQNKGTIALVDSIVNNTSIKSLYLNLYNGISDQAVLHIAKVLLLSASTVLQAIDLSGNKISDIGAAALLESLEARSRRGLSAIEINIGGNGVAPTLVKKIVSTAKISSRIPSESQRIEL